MAFLYRLLNSLLKNISNLYNIYIFIIYMYIYIYIYNIYLYNINLYLIFFQLKHLKLVFRVIKRILNLTVLLVFY